MDAFSWAHAWQILQARLLDPSTGVGALPLPLLLLLMGAAVVVPLLPRLWRVAGYAVTVYHETGHALAAVLTLQRLQGIRVNGDQSGDTRFLGSGFWPFQIWTAAWGYLFPLAVGVLYLLLALKGLAGLGLTGTLLFALALVFQIRNLGALFTILPGAVGCFLLWWYLPAAATGLFLWTLGWFLLAGGTMSIVTLLRLHLRGEGEGSDAQALGALTWTPSLLWCLLFLAAALYAVWQGLLLTGTLF